MTVNEQRWEAPLYWTKRDGRWWNFTLSGFRPVDESEPVTHVSYFEADAYANWAGARLANGVRMGTRSVGLPDRGKLCRRRAFSSARIIQFGTIMRVCAKCLATFGNGRAARTPLIQAIARRRARSANTTASSCATRYVLRGGSCATSRSHIRRTYRNFFQPEKRWQFTGIRLARDPQ